MSNLRGLSFPLRFGPTGSFVTSSGINKIKDNIKNIIYTSYGERFMSPNFGSVGYLSLFRNLAPQSIESHKTRLRESIEVSDNRIIVVDLDIIPADRDGRLFINMTFKLDNYSEYHDLSILIQE